MPEAFRLPSDGLTFTDSVYSRAEALVRARIWDGLTLTRLRSWRANFHGDVEKYFSACVLDELIYRSDAQTEAMARYLWLSVLPREAPTLLNAPPKTEEIIHDLFSQRSHSATALVVPVVRHTDIGKSGHVITRMLEKRLRMNPNATGGADRLARNLPPLVIFIDDFLGSGNQFYKFAKTYNLRNVFPRVACIYAPLVAHASGVSLLARMFPQLTVIPGELLSARHSLFSRDSRAFGDGTNSPAAAHTFYRDLRRRHGIPRGWSVGGSGHLATAYVFEQSAPNNNIEILWAAIPGAWNPLFDR